MRKPMLVIGILVGLLALTACASATPTPTSTPVPTATATPTPIPTPTPAPTPTSAASATSEASTTVTCADFDQQEKASTARPSVVARSVKARQGQSINVALCANPSTGYSWTFTSDNANVLSQTSKTFVAPPASAGLGTPGTEQFVFAGQKGSANLTFHYGRGATVVERTVTLQVTVDAP